MERPQKTVEQTPQRIAVVLECDTERDDGEWYVVAYLVTDAGSRHRATLKAKPTRQAAADALKDVWDQMCKR